MNKFEKVSYFQYGNEANINKKAEYDCIKLPKRATKCSAGYDFFAPCDFTLNPTETIKIATGIKAQLDDDKYLALYPRSSLGFKYRLQLDNSVGVVDSDYFNNESNEGHIFVKMTNCGTRSLNVKQGEAFAQAIVSQYFKTIDDDVDIERVGGIGSSGKR